MSRRPRAIFEFFVERTLFLCAAASILVTAGIIAVLLFETMSFLREVSVFEFLFGTEWTPLFSEKHFGVLPLVGGTVLTSLIVYAIAYAVIFGAGIWYLRKLMLVGPVPQPPKDTRGGEKTPARPMSLPDEPVDGPSPEVKP